MFSSAKDAGSDSEATSDDPEGEESSEDAEAPQLYWYVNRSTCLKCLIQSQLNFSTLVALGP